MSKQNLDQPIPKTKLKSKMCRVNYQCIMCGWNFQRPCGDTSGLGETLYGIERVYYDLNKEAFAGLFHKPHDSHVVHLHSRNGIDTACVWRNTLHKRDLKNKSSVQVSDFAIDDPHFQNKYHEGPFRHSGLDEGGRGWRARRPHGCAPDKTILSSRGGERRRPNRLFVCWSDAGSSKYLRGAAPWRRQGGATCLLHSRE
jgi:hypothetical protein